MKKFKKAAEATTSETYFEVIDLEASLAGPEEHERAVERLKELCGPGYSRRLSELVEVKGAGCTAAGGALVAMVICGPMAGTGVTPDPDWFCKLAAWGAVTSARLKGAVEDVMESLRGVLDPRETGGRVAVMLQKLAALGGSVNAKVVSTISVLGILRAARQDPRLHELMNWKPNAESDFSDIENSLQRAEKELVAILRDSDNPVEPYLRAGTGVNTRQLSQVVVAVGLKPDLQGNVIPHPVASSFLQGLSSVKDYMVVALGARKAQVTTYSQVKSSGYFTRKLSLLMFDVGLSPTLEDCGTAHYVRVAVPSASALRRLRGRIRVLKDGREREIKGDEEKLIGKRIRLRSPVSCASPLVCGRCYGPYLAQVNSDFHAGLAAAVLMSNQLTQMLLSAKHLLQTTSLEVEWPEAMTSTGAFRFLRNCVYLDPTSGVSVLIDPGAVGEGDAGTQDVYTFVVRGADGEEQHVEPEVDLSLSPRVMKMLASMEESDEMLVLSAKTLTGRGRRAEEDEEDGREEVPDEDGLVPIFSFSTENKELSSALKALIRALEGKEEARASSPSEAVTRMLYLLEEGKLDLPLVHGEMILRALFRDPGDHTRRPDWSREEAPETVMLTVPEAIVRSPSAAPGLAFERQSDQFKNPDTFMKNGYSMMDELFSK